MSPNLQIHVARLFVRVLLIIVLSVKVVAVLKQLLAAVNDGTGLAHTFTVFITVLEQPKLFKAVNAVLYDPFAE